MTSSINLQRTINWTKPYLKNQRLDFSNNEPALTTGNVVLGTIFGPPFRWRQNRSTFSFTTNAPNLTAVPPVPGQSDYTVALADFGFLEPKSCWCSDARGTIYAVTGEMALPVPTSASLQRPLAIAPQYDDNQGNITFRTDKMPNQQYTLGGDYQRKAPVLLSPARTISPLPDELGFLFDWGFLAVTSLLVNDARADWYEKKFVGRLLGTQDGLDEQAINLFLGQWQTTMKGIQRAQGAVQSGTLGRQS